MIAKLQNTMLTAAATALLLPAVPEAAEMRIELQRNPFARPAVDELVSNAGAVNEGLPAERDLGLRAVLVAESKSVVDIGGVILQVGECRDAVCLLSVEEGEVRIRRNDKEIVLSLYEQGNSEE